MGGEYAFLFFPAKRAKINQTLINNSNVPIETYIQAGYKLGQKLRFDDELKKPEKLPNDKIPSNYLDFVKLTKPSKEVVASNNNEAEDIEDMIEDDGILYIY